MIYIQRLDQRTHYLETVDECATPREARELIAEYRMSDPAGSYYTSSRSCATWYEKESA
jgi:hypothetical protein